MQIVARKPQLKQKIRSEELSITAKVVEVLNFEQVTNGYSTEQLGALKRSVYNQLGDNYRDYYFEVIVKVLYAKKDSEYKKGDIAVLTWDEFQRCKTLDK